MDAISPISVLIADDHALVRMGLQGILAHTPNIHVVDQAEDGLEAVQSALDHKPDVVLMDLQMPHMNGLDATQKIVQNDSAIKVIILTSLEKPEHLQQAMQVGARGYLIKNVLPKEMIQAIHTVAKGGYHFQSQTAPLCKPPSTLPKEPATKLSPKEQVVFELLIRGHSVAAIAQKLQRSGRTIRMHRERIRAKCGVKNDHQLLLWATEAGHIQKP